MSALVRLCGACGPDLQPHTVVRGPHVRHVQRRRVLGDAATARRPTRTKTPRGARGAHKLFYVPTTPFPSCLYVSRENLG